jgi:hypothetical protein
MGNDGKISDVLHQAKALKERDEKSSDQKNGRVFERTRPEPTIFGNCESWEFILGKKQQKHRRISAGAKSRTGGEKLQTTYPHFFNKLFRKNRVTPNFIDLNFVS